MLVRLVQALAAPLASRELARLESAYTRGASRLRLYLQASILAEARSDSACSRERVSKKLVACLERLVSWRVQETVPNAAQSSFPINNKVDQ